MRWLSLTIMAIVLLSGCPAPEGDGGNGTSTTSGSSTSPSTQSSTPATVAPPVTVWADPLLEPLLTGLAGTFSQYYPGGYSVEYVDRGALIARFADGAPETLPSIFMFSGIDTLRFLVEAGALNETTARIFAGDRLALIQRAEGGYATPTLFDIYKLRFNAIGVCSDQTTSGFYSSQALISSGVMPRIEDRQATADDVPALLEALKTDETQLALVPISAIGTVDGIEVVMIIGEDLYKDIQYSAASSTTQAPGQLELLMFLSEDAEIQEKIPGYGYLDLELALVED